MYACLDLIIIIEIVSDDIGLKVTTWVFSVFYENTISSEAFFFAL